MGDQAQQQAPQQAPVNTPTTDGGAKKTGGRGNDANQGQMLGANTGADSPELSDLFDAITTKYTQILLEQARGVDELGKDASVQDPPPAWVNIAVAVGTIAIGAATAGIGAAVSGAIVSAAASSAAKIVINDAFKEVIKVGVEQGLSATVQGTIGALAQNPATNVTDAFFRGQSDALHERSNKTQDAFTLFGRKKLRAADDPVAAAQAMYDALNSGLAGAKLKQRQATLSSWCNFQARGELGTHNEGKDNAGADVGKQLGDTSGKGVLGLVVESPGGQAAVKVVDAEIEGLNETLRGELAGRPIGQLGIPITVKGEVNPPAWYEKRSADGILRFGENESGTRWNKSSSGGDNWLMWKGVGGPVLTGPGGFRPDEKEKGELVWKGIGKVLDNEIKPKSLKAIGVDLTDPSYVD
ncbi:MAG: hypothetical protein ACOZNI_02895 [Myxococcota bacterium]